MDFNLMIWIFLLMPVFGVCSIHPNFVWLTGSHSKSMLRLKCYVKYLKLQLKIERNNIERGLCSSRFPSSTCYPYPYGLNETMHQNVTTNITTFTMIFFDPESPNGHWKCLHGQDSSSLSVNISANKHGSDDDIPLNNDDDQCYIYVFLYEIAACAVSFIATVSCLKCKTIRDTKGQILTVLCSFLDNCVDRVSDITNNRISKNVLYIALKVGYTLLLIVCLLSPLINHQRIIETCEGTITSVITGTVLGPLFALLFHKEKACTECCLETPTDHIEEGGEGGTTLAVKYANRKYEAVAKKDNEASSTNCIKTMLDHDQERGEGDTCAITDVHHVNGTYEAVASNQENEASKEYREIISDQDLEVGEIIAKINVHLVNGTYETAADQENIGSTKRKMAMTEMFYRLDTIGPSNINIAFHRYFHPEIVGFNLEF